MTPERAKRIVELREEGEAAFNAGHHVKTNPYSIGTMDRHWWLDGWCRGYDVNKSQKAQEQAKNET